MVNVDKWFEPRCISYWFGVIFRVRIAFRKTVVGFIYSTQKD